MTIPVAIRLGLEGGQAATRGVEEFGNKGQRSFRDIRKEAAALPPHLVAVSRGVGAVKDKVDDLAASSGVLGDVAASFGGYGVAAAAATAVVAGAAMALNRAALAAIEFGDEIDGAAQRAGVNTDTLQELRYAVKMTGGEYADADAAIGAFTKTLGLAESGNAKALKNFKQLGFTQADLKAFKSADEALMSVAQRVAELDKETERQAIADKLGISALIPVLREGAVRFGELRGEAHDVGIASQDVTKRAAELQDRLDQLSMKTLVKMNSELVEAGPLLVDMAEAFGRAKVGAANFFGQLSDAKPAFDDFLRKAPLVQEAIKRLADASLNFTGLGYVQRGIEKMGAPARARSLGASIQSMLKGDLSPMELRDGDWAPRTASNTVRGRQLLNVSSDEKGSSGEAARLKRELEQARKEAEKLELATRQAAGAAIAYADATAKAAAEAAGDASTLDYLERVTGYYADLNGLLKGGVDLLEAKALVQDRILAQARAEMAARSNPEGFKSASQGLAEALGGAVITAPEMDFDWLRIGAGDAFHDGLMAAADNGDFFEAFEARLRYAAASALAGQLTNALFAKSSSGGGWFSKLAGAAASALGGSAGSDMPIFGGGPRGNPTGVLSAGRATGGPVYRGDVRPIDEYGIERFARFSGDGYIHEAGRTAREITDRSLVDQSTYGGSAGGGGGPITVSLSNNSPMPLQATARETDDGMGGRKINIDIVELIDSRVAKGNRDLFGGDYDSAFASTFGARRRLNGG